MPSLIAYERNVKSKHTHTWLGSIREVDQLQMEISMPREDSTTASHRQSQSVSPSNINRLRTRAEHSMAFSDMIHGSPAPTPDSVQEASCSGPAYRLQLMGLPVEIRLMIYKLCLNGTPIKLTKSGLPKLPLLHVSRQIRTEILSCLGRIRILVGRGTRDKNVQHFLRMLERDCRSKRDDVLLVVEVTLKEASKMELHEMWNAFACKHRCRVTYVWSPRVVENRSPAAQHRSFWTLTELQMRLLRMYVLTAGVIFFVLWLVVRMW